MLAEPELTENRKHVTPKVWPRATRHANKTTLAEAQPHFIARVTRCSAQSVARLTLGRHMHVADDEWT